jgi:hypothetical protein
MTYTNPPLPFIGNKKLWIKTFKKLIAQVPDDYVFVDLFGGSGILSRYTKDVKPNATVIYNDFDGYVERLNKIDKTNEILEKLRQVITAPHDKKITPEEKHKVDEIIKQHDDIDYKTIYTNLVFSGRMKEYDIKAKVFYNKIVKKAYQCDGYLDNLIIEHKDWKQLYDEVKNKYEKIVFILDPPYLFTLTKFYRNYFNLTQTTELFDVMLDNHFILFNDGRTGIENFFNYLLKRLNINKDVKIECKNYKQAFQSPLNDFVMYSLPE